MDKSIIISIESAREIFIKGLQEKRRASATILAYGKDIEQLTNFLEKIDIDDLHSITFQHLEAFIENLKKQNYTSKSVSRKINSIKSFFRYLRQNKHLESSPARNITHPRYEIKPPRILSKIEYRALRDACRSDSRISAIVEILLQTGIRIGELANLKIDDFNPEKTEITVRAFESHPERRVPLTRAAKQSLEEYLKDRPKSREKTLFLTKTGKPFLIRNIRSAIDRYFKLAGIENAKVNDLRHTFIAQQLMAGTPLVYLSKLAGHKRLSTTEKYLKVINEKSEKEDIKLEEL